MAYEIRVVFQTIEAYQSAVDRLYAAFGVGLPVHEVDTDGAVEQSDDALEMSAALDADRLDEPDVGADRYSFVVEDRTR